MLALGACRSLKKSLLNLASSPWMWQLVDKPFFAGEHGCSVDDLRRIYTEEKAKFFAKRAKDIGRNRTAKHDIAYAAALWNINNASELHKKLAAVDRERKELRQQRDSVTKQSEMFIQTHNRILMQAADREAQYQAKLEAAIEPELERQVQKTKAECAEQGRLFMGAAAESRKEKAKYTRLIAEHKQENPTQDEQVHSQPYCN